MGNSVDFSAEDLRSDSQRSLYAWFSTFSERNTLPSRADFDPLDFPSCLRHLILLDVEHSPTRFRIRLMGTAITEVQGRDVTGHYYDEIEGAEDSIRRADATVQSRKPGFISDIPMIWSSKDYKLYSTLYLPLSSNGKTIDMIMYCHSFE